MRSKCSVYDGMGKIVIPYRIEGVLLVNVSDYNTPCFVEQSLYIVGTSRQHSDVRFEKIYGSKNYINKISQSDGVLNFQFNQNGVLCRVISFGE